MKHAYEFMISLRHRGDLSASAMLYELQRFISKIEGSSPNLRDWWLGGDTKQEALLHEVFKDGRLTDSALSAVGERLEGKSDPRIITIWNGKEKHEGASIRFIGRPPEYASLITLVGRPKSFLSNYHAIADLMRTSIAIWPPDFISVESNGYFERKIFKDRPGVGWMLYLPRTLTVQQVPEARALVPVMVEDDRKIPHQIGTIIVSVTDEAFSDENPEHVRIANAIEIRLVDQDLLPRYADL
jgi:hypothetical protein